jgi:hypothetical protein
MRNNYLPYNPVFESLSEQIKKHESGRIYEAEMKADKVEDYAKRIFSTLTSNVQHFFLSIPDDVKAKVFPLFIQAATTPLPAQTKLGDIIKTAQELWNKAKAEASASKNKDLYAGVFDKVNRGFEQVAKAYEALQAEAGDFVNDPAITASVIEQINSFNDKFIKDWKAKTSQV